MAQRVLLGSKTPDALQAVREGLEAAGHEVQHADDVEGVIHHARSKKVDLVVVAEELDGGTGADVCAVLAELPGHAPVLIIARELVPGAYAFAPPEDTPRILQQALSLLEGVALI